MPGILSFDPWKIETNKIGPRPTSESVTSTNVAIMKIIRSAIADIKIT